MLVFHNKKSEPLARSVADGLDANLGKLETRVFPDGEVYVRLLSAVQGEDAVLISTTRTNEDLIELILTLSAIKENGAKSTTCVVPHLVYQRQDSAFKEGEAVSAKVVLKLLATYADRIMTVNAHFLERAGKAEFGGVKVTNMDAFPLLGRYFKDLEDLLIVSPDEGSMHYAKAAADAVGCEYDHLVKKRLDGETVEIQPGERDVGGRNVVILDDIIATGGTMKRAADTLLSKGAKRVSLGCVHGIFTKGTGIFGNLEVICTDSLPTGLSRVTLAPMIVKALE